MQVANRPAPFKGGDGRYHLAYELTLENFAGDRVRVDNVQVLDAPTGVPLAVLDAAMIAARLVVRDRQATAGELGASQVGILYLHVLVDEPAAIPRTISHRLTTTSKEQTVVATAGCTNVAPPTGLVLDAPLRGARYVAGDGCCDSTRHVRATLPLNGTAYGAQRFAIDCEFRATRRGISTAAYDKATTDGKPMEIVPLAGPAKHQHELPLDLWITDLPE